MSGPVCQRAAKLLFEICMRTVGILRSAKHLQRHARQLKFSVLSGIIAALAIFLGLASSPVNAAPEVYTYCYGMTCYESLNAAENAMHAKGPVDAYLEQSYSYMRSDGTVSIVYRVPDQPPDILGDPGYFSGLGKPLGYECELAMTPFAGFYPGCKNEQEGFDVDIAYLTSQNGNAGCYAIDFHVTGEYDEDPFNSIHATPYDAGWFIFTSYSNTRKLKYSYTCPGYFDEREVEYQKIQTFSCKPGFRPFAIAGGLDEIKRRWPWKTYCGSDLAAEIQVRLLQNESCEANKNPCYPATGDKARFESGFEFAGRNFEHVYHSVRQFPSRLFPAGWRLSFEERLLPMSDNSNRYTYVNSKGYAETFWFANNAAAVGYSSSGSGKTLRRVPNDYDEYVKLVTQDGDVRSFDRNGYLVGIESTVNPKSNFRVTYFGEGMFNEGRVATLIDGMGREVRFTYKPHDLLLWARTPGCALPMEGQQSCGGNPWKSVDRQRRRQGGLVFTAADRSVPWLCSGLLGLRRDHDRLQLEADNGRHRSCVERRALTRSHAEAGTRQARRPRQRQAAWTARVRGSLRPQSPAVSVRCPPPGQPSRRP